MARMTIHPTVAEVLEFAESRIVELGGQPGEIKRWQEDEAAKRREKVEAARHVPIYVDGEALEVGQLYRVTYEVRPFHSLSGGSVREKRHMWLHGRLLNGDVAFRWIARRRQYGDDVWGTGRHGRGGYVIMEDRDIIKVSVEEDLTPGLRREIDRIASRYYSPIPEYE